MNTCSGSFSTTSSCLNDFIHLKDSQKVNDWANKNIVRAINEWSKRNREDDDVVRYLLEEASRGVRITSYSMMDLSELFHVVCTLLQKSECLPVKVREGLNHFLETLVEQIISRRHCVCIQNQFEGSSQALSIIGVSNMLFAMRTFRGKIGLFDVVVHALRFRCEKDAVLACRPFHINSILESLLTIPNKVSDDIWVILKRFMKEHSRKREFMSPEDVEYTNSIRELAMNRFSENPLRVQIIDKYLT